MRRDGMRRAAAIALVVAVIAVAADPAFAGGYLVINQSPVSKTLAAGAVRCNYTIAHGNIYGVAFTKGQKQPTSNSGPQFGCQEVYYRAGGYNQASNPQYAYGPWAGSVGCQLCWGGLVQSQVSPYYILQSTIDAGLDQTFPGNVYDFWNPF